MRHPLELEELNRDQHDSEQDSFTPNRYEQMAAHLPVAGRLLDVGCNTGRGGSVLRRSLPAVTLVGVEMLADRAERIPSGIYEHVYSQPLEDLDVEQGFDGVVMGELIEHVPYSSLEGFLDAVRRSLKPGGVLVLTTPNPHYLLLRWRNRGSVLGGAHVSVHCAEALGQYLRHVGFDDVAVFGTGRVSTKVGSRLPLFLYGSYLLRCTRR